MPDSYHTEKPLIKYHVRAFIQYCQGEPDDDLELAAFVLEAESADAARAAARSYERVILERYEAARGVMPDSPMEITVTPVDDWIAKSIAYGKGLEAARDAAEAADDYETGE